MEIPLLVSRFPGMEHPQKNEIIADTKQFFSTEAFDILDENTRQYGDYVAAGALYSIYIYPLGDTRKLKAVARFFAYWALIDDRYFDNSTDLDDIRRLMEQFVAAMEGTSDDERFAPVHAFCSRPDWNEGTLALFRNEMKKYLDGMMHLRIAEVQEQLLTVDEYLRYRHYNIAMWVIFSILYDTQDDLELSTFRHPGFAHIFDCSSRCIAVLLDLYNLKARKAEKSDYTNLLRVMQRAEGLDEDAAIRRCIQLFYDYELEMEEACNKLEADYPREVLYFKYVESGSVRYCTESRKMRYRQLSDADEDLVNGRTVL
ncbi:hypothetical protein HF329_09285 [Chitinophaga oryzae]|uniref:Terpene synthase n=1 Tax=Chitinophaga oryzae TaxID=2725414 RepID=A0AAE7D692_9BACT|nr:hypothetical protein [Chitinophaga oryzae]QJB31485.1 hypothetical protein HF329_09285 [Chitinophaga oryzae]